MKKHSAISGQQSAKASIRLAVWLGILLACSCRAFAFDGNNLEQELRAKYQGQTVMLRDSYCGKELQFDAQGDLVSGGYTGSWTLCRDVKVEKLRVEDGKLRISGNRIYLRYDDGKREFRDVTLDEPQKNKDAESYKDLLKSLKVVLEAPLPPASDDAAVQALMNKIFYASEQEFLASPPQLWRKFFHVADKPGETQLLSGETIEKVGSNGVKLPTAIFSPDPDYSDESRLAKYQGVTVLNTVVDANGKAVRIRVVRPLGMGLDEQAAAKISLWKFKPATRNGTPVPVEVSIEVSFNLY